MATRKSDRRAENVGVQFVTLILAQVCLMYEHQVRFKTNLLGGGSGFGGRGFRLFAVTLVEAVNAPGGVN